MKESRSLIQRLHDSEINGGIAWPVQGLILAYFGCPLDGINFDEALVGSFAEAESWLDRAAASYFPESVFAKQERLSLGRPSSSRTIDLLHQGGIAGGAYWVFDSAFAAFLGDPGSTQLPNELAGVSSWAAAEAWLEQAAHKTGRNG